MSPVVFEDSKVVSRPSRGKLFERKASRFYQTVCRISVDRISGVRTSRQLASFGTTPSAARIE